MDKQGRSESVKLGLLENDLRNFHSKLNRL